MFTGHYGVHPHEALFDRICRENGIRHLLTGIRSPTTTGKIERFHRTLRQEHLSGKVFASSEVAQRELDDFVTAYNTERPHQALGMLTPNERFRIDGSEPGHALAPELGAIDDGRDGDGWVSRKVASNGVITVDWQQLSVGKHFGGERVDVHVTPTLLEIWLGSDLIKTAVRQRRGEVRKKNAEGTRRQRLSKPLSAGKRRGSPEHVSSGIR